MRLLIDSKHKDSLHKACLEHGHEVQFHQSDETEILHAYVTSRGRELTESQSFWLGVNFQTELSRVLLEA